MTNTINNIKIRIIGDLHGHYKEYLEIIKGVPHTLQLGDFGFDYSCLNDVDGSTNRICAGNHDNYSKVWEDHDTFSKMQSKHWLGDYGIYEVPGFGEIFYLRGGHSIDWMYRKEGRDYWKDEQLSYKKMQQALEFYIEKKPDFVITHECPGELIEPAFGAKKWDGEWLKPSATAKLLDQMWSNHAPKHWFFGHHHKYFNSVLKGTNFICLPELGYIDLDENKNIVTLVVGNEIKL